MNGRAVREEYAAPDRIDSVYFGPVVVPDGKVFVMGDNRGNSWDSRAFGPVAQDDLRGRVVARAVAAEPRRGDAMTPVGWPGCCSGRSDCSSCPRLPLSRTPSR